MQKRVVASKRHLSTVYGEVTRKLGDSEDDDDDD